MEPSVGPPVTGDDFFNRENELRLLEARVRSGTHILLAGQRRMGKTSIAKELGRRLQNDGWEFLFVDVEDAASPQDVIRDIAKAAHAVAARSSRLAAALTRWFKENIEELSAFEFGVKVRAGGTDYAWRRQGEALIQACADHESGVLLVLDELPIFLSRLWTEDERLAQLFLRWLRSQRQQHAGSSLALVVSGSIGLAPLVPRMGLPDTINDLYNFRLGPWNRDHSVECLRRLGQHNAVRVRDAALHAVYDTLGLGIPHFVQSYFARLQDFAAMNDRSDLTVEDVHTVYKNELLGPAGHGDLLHYENRLRTSLDEDTFRLAMEIQAEAATQGTFTVAALRCLSECYASVMPAVGARIDQALDVLVHDGHLESFPDGHRLPFRLLADWLRTRFGNHHVPLQQRSRKSR